MDQHVDLITIGVPDLAVARRFYLDGLGWRPALDVPGEILFLQVGHGLLLALFGDLALTQDVDPTATAPASGISNVTLAHNVGSDGEVRAVLDAAVAAGARLLKPAQPAVFGGLHGYFADPSGLVWEVAHNPGWSVAKDGTVTIG